MIRIALVGGRAERLYVGIFCIMFLFLQMEPSLCVFYGQARHVPHADG